MGRPPRVQFPGAFYHVMSRGNSQQEVFLSDDDRLVFLEKFAEVVSELSWSCYAYCLMNNHYHLLVETPQANLSRGMHKLNNYYSKRFNWKQEKVGHVLQGRFVSRLVERDEHLMEIIRYIALNPVRGGLASEPGQWRWNSYQAISGLVPAPGFLDVNYTLDLFGSNKAMARLAYIRFVADGLRLDRTDQTTLKTLFQRVRGKNERNRAICIAHFKYGYTTMEIATFLGLSRSTVNRALRK